MERIKHKLDLPLGDYYIVRLIVLTQRRRLAFFAKNLVSSGLYEPNGVAVDKAGNVYIADTGNSAIKEWIVTNNTQTTLISSNLSSPQDVAVDGSGNVYIADTLDSAIKEWTVANSNLTTLAAGIHLTRRPPLIQPVAWFQRRRNAFARQEFPSR